MHKNKWILCVLLAGLLLCGVGGGIMFVEFTSLNYAGEYAVPPENIVTKTVDFSLEDYPEGSVRLDSFYDYSPEPLSNRVIVDENMEEGLLRFEFSYGADEIDPYITAGFLDEEGIYWETSSYRASHVTHMSIDREEVPKDAEARIEIGFYSYFDDFSAFFRIKDMVMKDLKNNTLRSYHFEDVTELHITVGPETARRLRF